MADDVTLPGTGAVIATDDIGSGRQVQLVKPVYGDDSFSTMASLTNPFPVADQPLVQTGSVTSATNIVASTDCAAYASFKLLIARTGSAQVIIEGSNDNTNWTGYSFLYTNSPGSFFNNNLSAASSALTVNGSSDYYAVGSIISRYVRVRVSSYTSGTITATLALLKTPAPVVLTYSVTGSSGSTNVTPSGNTFASTDTNSNSVWGSVFNENLDYIGGASSQWARRRMPNIIKSVSATASGNTAVWTPTSGRKFRLLKFQLFLTSDATIASGGLLTVKFQDATVDAGISVPVYVPGTGGTLAGGWRSGTVDFGGWGYISSAANNVLNVNLSSALTAGSLGVIACGTEE